MLEPGYLKLLEKMAFTEVEIQHQSIIDLNDGLRLSDSYDPEMIHAANSNSDSSSETQDTAPMTEITREELNAKLEALESRMDSRVVAIGGKIDAFLAAQAERDKAADFRFGRIEADLSGIKDDLKTSNSEIGGIRRWQAAYAAGVTLLAFLIGIGVTVGTRLLTSAPPH